MRQQTRTEVKTLLKPPLKAQMSHEIFQLAIKRFFPPLLLQISVQNCVQIGKLIIYLNAILNSTYVQDPEHYLKIAKVRT